MYVCMHVCMYVCMYGWMDRWMEGWIYVFGPIHLYEDIFYQKNIPHVVKYLPLNIYKTSSETFCQAHV